MKKSILFLSIFGSVCAFGQDTLSTLSRQAAQNNISLKPGKSKFMMRGYFHTGLDGVTSNGETDYNFSSGSIAPILMYKQSDKLFFEAEFDGQLENGEFNWGLEYADVSYILNKYVTVRAGQFLIPFGAFMEKLHPAWVNRLATKPLGFGDNGVAPTNDVGAELRGAFYAGSIKLNYQAYIINGAQLKDGGINPSEAGMLRYGTYEDNNNNKTVGGRVGVFPFSNSMLELGFSGQTGIVGSKGSIYKNVRANLYALDLSLVKKLSFIKSLVDIKGQYNYSQVGNANYFNPEDSTNLLYNFNNVTNSYYAQLSIKPLFVDNNFIRKLELVGRYSSLKTPDAALWAKNPSQIALGLNYWIDWRTVIKLGYQTTDGVAVGGSSEPISTNMFYIHWAMGF